MSNQSQAHVADERAAFEAAIADLSLTWRTDCPQKSIAWRSFQAGFKAARAASTQGADVAADIPAWQVRMDDYEERFGKSAGRPAIYYAKEEIADLRARLAAGAPAETTDQVRANFEDWYVTHIEGAVIGSADCAKQWSAWLAGSSGHYKAPSGWIIAPMPWGAPAETPKPVGFITNEALATLRANRPAVVSIEVAPWKSSCNPIYLTPLTTIYAAQPSPATEAQGQAGATDAKIAYFRQFSSFGPWIECKADEEGAVKFTAMLSIANSEKPL